MRFIYITIHNYTYTYGHFWSSSPRSLKRQATQVEMLCAFGGPSKRASRGDDEGKANIG